MTCKRPGRHNRERALAPWVHALQTERVLIVVAGVGVRAARV